MRSEKSGRGGSRRGSSRGGEPPPSRGPSVRKTKRQEKVERATAIRAGALKLLGAHGRWQTLNHGLEVLCFEDARFHVMFHVKQPAALELRRRFGLGPLPWGLYGLEFWLQPRGKVLNLNWPTVGAPPRIVTFKRGEWEQRFLESALNSARSAN